MSRTNVGEQLERVFWSRVLKTENCWLWTGAKNKDGYGNVRVEGFVESAHRVSYKLTYGAVPYRKGVLHKCDNKACVRPDHLFLGNQSSNMFDAAHKNRHGVQKLTDEQIKEIRRRYKAGENLKQLSTVFNCSRPYVCQIVNRNARTDVPDE